MSANPSVKSHVQAPPPYVQDASSDASATGARELSFEFSKLRLEDSEHSSFPPAAFMLVHLKLLQAFENLKHTVGNCDGLWDIWDHANDASTESHQMQEQRQRHSSKAREKRWAVFVARAVDRYESWWKSFVPDMLTDNDMLAESGQGSKYGAFVSQDEAVIWTPESLPPLDVIMIWHTHMLNPRTFLEVDKIHLKESPVKIANPSKDCLRYGYGPLWRSGIPWALINSVIDDHTFVFSASGDCQTQWTRRTDRAWRNEEDSLSKILTCPFCLEEIAVPWTTCGGSRGGSGPLNSDMSGKGFADGSFSAVCPGCGETTNEDLLRVVKFKADVKHLVQDNLPMPGTILGGKGVPHAQSADSDQMFPNRLVRKGFLVEVTNLSLKSPGLSMMMIKDLIEDITAHTNYRHSTTRLKKVDKGAEGIAGVMGPHKLSREARMQTRAMMARYWENSSVFALDLRGAVMRQGVFVSKMSQIDWLHSPAVIFTIDKARKKYERFFEIASIYPDQVVTPTLDVDLAWHTHQLSPPSYFNYAVSKTGAFTDHNDKVDEDKLAISFDWMVSNSWRSDESNPGAHISSHPAVVAEDERNGQRKTDRMIFHNDLNDAYQKMTKQASKRTAKLAPTAAIGTSADQTATSRMGEDHCDHWGVTVELAGPWSSETVATLTKEMYASHPGLIHTRNGQAGACAAGTCGGSLGCGSGAVALCGAGCTGMGRNLFGAGCQGIGKDSK
ncbi:putative Alpha-ketoglutarate-dependent sulfonate dioxygenase [Seiridium unicorne]|uniref:Alpha-ketoglutarate-dependent sulfonate dioxygenase n=1 Tax=Seiridium unicorne TaxID=138068 RepID=A0ABR2UXX8_9PEZI